MAGYLRRSNILMLGIILGCLIYSNVQVLAAKENLTIKDMAGRSVRIPQRVSRIVPLGGALRFVVYLQALDKVAGVERLEKQKPLPTTRVYSLAVEKIAQSLPDIGEGGPGKLPDFEKIIAVRPDLILAMGVDLAQVETIQQKTGIPVVVLSYGSPGGGLDKENIFGSLRLAGKFLDKSARAEEVIAFIKKSEKDLRDRTSDIPDGLRPRAYVGAIGFKGVHGLTSTEAFYLPLEWVQARNVANEIGRTGHNYIDPEKLLLWNPEFIFIDAGGLEMVQSDYRRNAGFYRRLSAVQKNRVFLTLPYNYYHTNIEIMIADAYFIGRILYPTHFADIEPAKKTDEIFNFFIGLPVYNRIKKELYGFGKVLFEKEGLRIQ